MVESRPTSDRSSFRIGRAYFTHPSLCLRHCVFQHNSRWTCHGIWAESTRAWLNHSFQSQRWRVWFLDMRFFRITRSILDLSNRSVVCFYGFNDCNSVHYQCGRRSCWYSVSIYSRLTMFSNADATLVGELLSTSVYTVHMLAHDGSNLTNFQDNGHPGHIHRRCYAISREWNITYSLGACKFVISSNASWYSKRLMSRVDFSEPPLRGWNDAKSERLPSRAK